ncbi:uncharacterized protein LOC120215764 [Hibiscus syriacus]|uniref:uncharacterized protein LOC120215764 n=1 Tax=Hibiscus syriacus TaxID=106335 RepID=UPI0019224563|nr:uncharacterized protein LOC120215764 [Hibiscus syriacus]
MDGQTERLNKCLEQYLRCVFYQTIFMVQVATSSRVVESLRLGSSRYDAARDQLNKLLKEQLSKASNRMKQIDRHITDREFNVGDEVYLKLQPYRHTSLALRKNLKLVARYFGPYKIQQRIGQVAYMLQLPSNSKLHLVFHISLLKKNVGKGRVPSIDPSDIKTDGQLKVYPTIVLNKRIVKRHNQAVTQLLIQWTNMGPTEATW